MKIGFWLTTPKKINPEKINNTPFGGAEISAINLSKCLAKNKNNEVTIFGNVSCCKESHNIEFTSYDNLRYSGLDVLVCVRADQNLLNPRRNFKFFGKNKPGKVILWTGDAYDQPNNQIFWDKYCLDQINLIICKSNWQKETLIKNFPLLSGKRMQVMYNGVDCGLRLMATSSCKVTNPSFVYASTAYRGLHKFLTIWPKILEEIPNATLDCFCKTNLYIDNNSRDVEFQPLYDKISKLKGVTIKEPLPQKEFHKELIKYYAMLYPNYGFMESSCGVALESMALGVPVITTAFAGLIETCKMGGSILINRKDINGVDLSGYDKCFVNVVVNLWSNKRLRNFLSSQNKNILDNYNWRKISKKWEKLLYLEMESLTQPQECRESLSV